MHGIDEKYILVGKREGVRPLWRPRRWEEVRIVVGCEGVDWIQVVRIRSSGGLSWTR